MRHPGRIHPYERLASTEKY
ncbi:hypothetical protein NIBR502773_04025 [Pseudomonas sp. NIBRBAC000502773]|nr:hypothetical protein NIBR502773_04025 [Pseudomonas sp. NIBRBAC000502773]